MSIPLERLTEPYAPFLVITGGTRAIVGRVGSWVGVVLCLASIAGCVVQPGPAPEPDASPARSVVVEDDELVLREGNDRRTLTTFDDADGTPIHAALRPGETHDETVVVLWRVADPDDPLTERYELRYLVATDESVSELYGFPAGQQVAAESPAILDVAPVPVWSPEGDAIAWIEWVEQGTRLRTVGWTDDGGIPNPSDEAAAYALADVPPGVQLEDWRTSADGDPVLLGRQGDRPYRIRLALGDSPTGVTAGR